MEKYTHTFITHFLKKISSTHGAYETRLPQAQQETMIVSGDRNIHVISAETFVLFDDHASVEDAGMQTNNYRTILIIRR